MSGTAPSPFANLPAPGSHNRRVPGIPLDIPAAQVESEDPDLAIWQYWWGFQRERYLLTSVRPRVRADDVRERIVPALLRALEVRESTDMVCASLIALARIGDGGLGEAERASPTVQRIRPYLVTTVDEIQETATRALGVLGSEDGVTLLEALLLDDRTALRAQRVVLAGAVPMRTRAFAAYALGLIASGPEADEATRARVAPILMRALRRDLATATTCDVPVACTVALGLAPLAWEGSPSRADQVGLMLELMGGPEIHPFVRAQAVTALARLLDQEQGPAEARHKGMDGLLGILRKPDEVPVAVQQSAVLALGQLADGDGDSRDVAAREALFRASTRLEDVQARRFALIALAQASGRLRGGSGTLTEDELAVREEVRGHLLEHLFGSDAESRSWAGLALAVLERSLRDRRQPTSEDARRALEEAFDRAQESSEIGALAIALGILEDRAAASSLRRRLGRPGDFEMRGYVAVALGMVGDPGAIPPLTDELLRSKYLPDLLRSAATGLVLLGDPGLADELIRMLGRASGLSSQASISMALGVTRDARAVEPLLELLGDETKTQRARGFAACALGLVADKEDLSWFVRLSWGLNYRAAPETLTSPTKGCGFLDSL